MQSRQHTHTGDLATCFKFYNPITPLNAYFNTPSAF